MAFPKLNSPLALSFLAGVALVLGLVIAVFGTQQNTERRSHAAGGSAVGDVIFSGGLDPSKSNAGVGPITVHPGYTYKIVVSGYMNWDSDYSTPLYVDAQWGGGTASTADRTCWCHRFAQPKINGAGFASDETKAGKPVNNAHTYTYHWTPAQGVTSMQFGITDSNLTDNTSIGFKAIVTVESIPNVAPTVSASASPSTITLPTTTSVTLTGTAADSDGTIASYVWSGPAGTITNPNAASTTVTNFSIPGSYTYTLRVTDNGGATSTATVTVTVNGPANKAPTANAGADQTITLPTSSVTLNGSGTDSDGTIASYKWTQTAGETVATISNSTAAKPSVSGLQVGLIYTFNLQVTDNAGATANDTVNVTVLPAPNKPPTVTIGPAQTITLPTDSVTIAATATDSDGTITDLSWSKVSGPDSGNFVTPSAANTGVTDLIPGTYVFRLTATDDQGAIASADVTITVLGASSTTVGLDLLLHGIGKAGDSANPTGGGGNTNLVHFQRTVTVEVFDKNNNPVTPAGGVQGTVAYNATSGGFKGTVNLGSNIINGVYTVKVKLPQSLKKIIPGIQTIVPGTTNPMPQVTLVNGDINNDNVMNILDYDILIRCYSDILPAVNCTSVVDKAAADITDDGSVNQFDYNLFLRELSYLEGQ